MSLYKVAVYLFTVKELNILILSQIKRYISEMINLTPHEYKEFNFRRADCLARDLFYSKTKRSSEFRLKRKIGSSIYLSKRIFRDMSLNNSSNISLIIDLIESQGPEFFNQHHIVEF